MVDKGIEPDPADGVAYLSDKLDKGQCGFSISSVQQDHYGTWSCILLATEGQALTGTVDMRGE